MKHIVSWSGGKDSTATIILARELGLPIDLIIMALVWFDRKRGIYGERPEHLDWVFNYAKPLFESWGYEVKFVSQEEDYLETFYKIVRKSPNPEYNGKYSGFLISGKCRMQRNKVKPIRAALRDIGKPGIDYEEYVGICADEPSRLETLLAQPGKRSLLAENGYSQNDSRAKCMQYGLLSPDYSIAKRGGCWFCPNQSIKQLANLKQYHPELWRELELLSEETNRGTTVARGFQYGRTFEEIATKVDAYIANDIYEQLTIEQLYF